jgi:hypothetical protein
MVGHRNGDEGWSCVCHPSWVSVNTWLSRPTRDDIVSSSTTAESVIR